MAETVVKTVENVDRLFSQIVVNGEVYESENYVAPTPSQSVPQTQPVITPETQPSAEQQNVQGEDIYGVDLNDVLHNFVDNTVPDKIQQAVQSLDVPSSGGSGKYIKSISQTDGKIMTTEGDITDSVTQGSSDPVTSGAVADILSALPTDAVLHYSFDEVPDLPDGTADVRYLNGNTYGVSLGGNGTVTTDPYAQDNKIHKSNVNGNANFKSDVSTTTSRGIYIAFANHSGKTVILDVLIKTPNLRIRIESQADSSSDVIYVDPLGTYNPSVGRYRIAFTVPTAYLKYTLIFYGTTSTEVSYTEWELLNYYIGDGSYVTPIIDNANGQNNATNNGGIATKGVSGKGEYFLNKKYVRAGSYNLSNDFTISVWVKPENNTTGLIGAIVEKTYHIGIRNGESWSNNLLIFIYPNGTEAIVSVSGLLPANVWTHLVLTKSGTTLKIYKNSTVVNTTTLSSNIMNQNDNNFDVCSSRNTRPQTIDDFLIFDRALSETEVRALYLNRANTPKYYPPVSISASKIPLPPSTDGNYNLQCTVNNEVPSYSWRGVVKGETVKGLGGVNTYTITLPDNTSSSVNVYRVLKGCMIVEDTATACFEITYGQTPNDNISVPTINFIASGLTMTYNQTDRTITFSSTTKRFYACIYSVQEIESYLGLPLTFA